MSMSYRGNGGNDAATTIASEGNMTGLLLESRAKRQRRAGGATLSIAIHTAIIGAIVAGTATARPAPKHVEPPVHVVLNPRPKRDEIKQVARTSIAASQSPIASPKIVVAPISIPVGIPPIELTAGISPDSIVIGGRASKGNVGRPGGSLDLTADDVPHGGEWGGTELLMRIVASRKPRYPESLRMAGIDGRVLVRFTVDTTGAVDMNSVTILASTHDLFTRSVRDVLSSYRFKPAELHGKRVPSLAEMPFEFSISR
jgi:protein TonB